VQLFYTIADLKEIKGKPGPEESVSLTEPNPRID
jgi:hypothetical protein